jgi:hypothetical protein
VEQGLAKPVVKKKQWMKMAKQGRRVAPRPAQPPAVQGVPSPSVAHPPAVLVEGATAGCRRVRSHEDQPAGRRRCWSWRWWWRGWHLREWKRLEKRTAHEDGGIVVLVYDRRRSWSLNVT